MVEVNDLTGKVNIEKLQKIVEAGILALKNKGILKNQEIEISIGVVGTSEIQDLNFQYRQKDEPTDVLSFEDEFDARHLSGEIVICPEVIQQFAQEDGLPYEQELKKNLVHGLLHLMRYDHGKEMFVLQQFLLETSAK